jgi:hypothetical protein
MKLTIILLFISSFAVAQRYDYAQIWTISPGINGMGDVDFYFSRGDSTAYYRGLRIPHITDAISTLGSNGWSLITINTEMVLDKMVTVAFLRRKR